MVPGLSRPTMSDDDRILSGIAVLDLTTFVTGGFCSLMLANQGADVVKVERPGAGDDNRHSGPPFVDGESPYFWTVNYDKRSIELDLRTDAGREAFYELAAEADVVLQNYRPGTAADLGVDEATVREHNDDLIYCSISAFGATGPWSGRPGYDLLVQGMSGLVDVTGQPDGPPAKVGVPATDLITAMWAAFGIVTALYRRAETGEGEALELGMLDATLPWLTKHAGAVFAGETPRRMGTKDPVLAPYQAFETADGYLTVAPLNEKLWTAFCAAIDRANLATDERFETNADRVENVDELEAELAPVFAERTTDEWVTALVEEAGVPAGPVHSVEEALYNEQTEARGTVTELDHEDRERPIPVVEHPLRFDGAESGFRSPPPRLGEHTREVLAEAGLSPAEVDALERRGAFGEPGD